MNLGSIDYAVCRQSWLRVFHPTGAKCYTVYMTAEADRYEMRHTRNQTFVELLLKLLGESDDQMKLRASCQAFGVFYFRSWSVKIIAVIIAVQAESTSPGLKSSPCCTCAVYNIYRDSTLTSNWSRDFNDSTDHGSALATVFSVSTFNNSV